MVVLFRKKERRPMSFPLYCPSCCARPCMCANATTLFGSSCPLRLVHGGCGANTHPCRCANALPCNSNESTNFFIYTPTGAVLVWTRDTGTALSADSDMCCKEYEGWPLNFKFGGGSASSASTS